MPNILTVCTYYCFRVFNCFPILQTFSFLILMNVIYVIILIILLFSEFFILALAEGFSVEFGSRQFSFSL